ncbi:metallophosphoesterase [Helicobacter fennelliae]|uniref:Calcineurin-like phosphoesterase domain-containing protein n=1 Tax=Helicobacter fennelliae MRY12-0050 TaxID=1325130 RepID=T1D1R2_9HELI|nr:metallophosphoesterase [Helicobacter fennelliae]GAD19176.1 hypothetical protein HFN_0307 [Helicobacter fennelliae MRY12-0050]STP08250.1 Predicted phosphoesterase or phosphohydrolase [Helicobacter fennelliae]
MSFKITLETFLISDTHFGHKAVLKKEPIRKVVTKQCGFKVFDDMSVYNWNQVVGDSDLVLHLGDLYFDDGYKYLPKLNGFKRLVVGNNDIGKFKYVKKMHDWKVCNKISLKIQQKERFHAKLIKKFGSELKNPYINAIIADFGSERIMFSHFPVMNRKKNDRFEHARDILDEIYKILDCSLNIHGHTHSKKTYNRFCINVSCEEIDFTPIRLREIIKIQ